jgi:DNA-nicking Smr family endonuclease
MKRAPQPSAEDRELFRDAIGPVRAIASEADPRAQTRPAPAPEPRQSQADERQVLAELLAQDEVLVGLASGDALSHLQDGYPPKLLRQLRRGQFVIEDELDLHHLRLHEARALLSQFLAECRKGGRRCVRVIHGKARGADQGSVIKAMTDRVLRQRADVIGFTSARPQEGGTGAVIVLLKAA